MKQLVLYWNCEILEPFGIYDVMQQLWLNSYMYLRFWLHCSDHNRILWFGLDMLILYGADNIENKAGRQVVPRSRHGYS